MSVWESIGVIIAIIIGIWLFLLAMVMYYHYKWTKEEKKEGRVGYSTEWGK